jgi:hypothetical protein
VIKELILCHIDSQFDSGQLTDLVSRPPESVDRPVVNSYNHIGKGSHLTDFDSQLTDPNLPSQTCI